MTTTCKNCKQNFKGNYCNNCGQSANTKEINLHFLWHDIQHGFFHFDNGIFYTIKSLILRPGYTISDFIEGKRVKHIKPFSFVFFLATIYGLLKHFIGIPSLTKLTLDIEDDKIVGLKNIMNWFNTHYAQASIMLLIFASISTFWAFRKQKYNLLQHFVLNAYLTGLTLVAKIAVVPLYYITEKDNWQIINIIPNILGVTYTFWAMYQIFDYLPKNTRLWKTILSYFFVALTYFLLGILFGTIIGKIIGKI